MLKILIAWNRSTVFLTLSLFWFRTFYEYFRQFWASAQILWYICQIILENSMLSKSKLIYLLKNEFMSPLNNAIIFYANLTSFDKIPKFFSIFGQKVKILVNIRGNGVIKIQNQLKSWLKGLYLQNCLIITKSKC